MPRRVLRWIGYGLSALVALLALAAAVTHIVGGRVINTKYSAALSPIAVPNDSIAIAEGGRLAAIRGCTGCHEQNLGGRVYGEHPLFGRLIAPNLTQTAREYTDAELARVIRHGVRKNGTGVLVMPSSMFYHAPSRTRSAW